MNGRRVGASVGAIATAVGAVAASLGVAPASAGPATQPVNIEYQAFAPTQLDALPG